MTTINISKSELDSFPTISAQIRHLSQTYTTGQIAKILTAYHNKEVRYQWVRNVLLNPAKNPQQTKKSKIIVNLT